MQKEIQQLEELIAAKQAELESLKQQLDSLKLKAGLERLKESLT